MKSFSTFLEEGKKKKRLNGITFQSIQDFITEALMEAAPFLGATTRPFPEKDLKDYLGRIVTKTKGKKEKYDLPYIHGGNIVITGETGQEFDLPALRTQISKRPESLLKQNEKMKHSDGTATQFFNIGLPALKGLAVNEKTGEFVIVDTCPGAGTCKTFCYAMKGGYVQWKASSMAQTRVLNFLMNDPDGFASALNTEISSAETKFSQKKGVKLTVRWHDAGDFFSPDYLTLAYAVARQHPDVDFYAYTKMASVASSTKPDNFLINFSAGAQPSQEKAIDFTTQKNSRVVPKELFKDLLTRNAIADLIQLGTAKKKEPSKLRFKSPQDLARFKDRLAEKYRIAASSILSYEEMQETPKGVLPKWNVIVLPGQGDESAARKDVLGTLLVFH